ncbi:MAG: hypothetical protein M1832_004848 [Thelocarpon impressellum]|nr:MAG: hypothetical protein M1832_004848 [Thelocarpon impressellum]
MAHPELPDDYDPDKGLPFQQHPLSKAEIAKIFGPSADVQLANRSLRILHGRRVAGIIGDAVSFPDPTGYSERFARTALRWLRANHPIDEEMAYNLRLERERREVEEDLIADAERLGIYKPQGGVKDGNVYGESGLDAIREHYERQPVKTKKRPSQVEEIETNTGTVSSVRGRADLRRTDTPEWIKPYIEKAMLTKAEAPPNQSSWRRIWPSAAVAGLVVGLSVFLADHYVPPPRSARLWPDMPPAAATLLAILMANSVVLVAWRIPMAWRFLNRYFLSVPGYPFALSVVGNMFSHQQFTHFAMNMVVLWIMGTRLHDEVGRGNFLAIYFSGGVVGSLFSLVSFVARKNLVTSSLGASGAIASVIASWCCVNSE